MSAVENDPFAAPPRRKVAHEIGEALDFLSADELRARIALLQEEIARLEAAAQARDASRRAADAFFKS
ncbi:MAG: DUF1192 domain-containing protein [Beijerinckiaceae bacterium]|jgi:uncharacterized small protein (DUF1192 family)